LSLVGGLFQFRQPGHKLIQQITECRRKRTQFILPQRLDNRWVGRITHADQYLPARWAVVFGKKLKHKCERTTTHIIWVFSVLSHGGDLW
jgi:hypothetical protein